MKENKVTRVRYTRSTSCGRTDEDAKGEVTERDIIPTFIPKPNIKALDVSDLPEEDQQTLESLYEEYRQYYQTASKTLFAFEDWASHTHQVDVSPIVKWRTFKVENLEEIE